MLIILIKYFSSLMVSCLSYYGRPKKKEDNLLWTEIQKPWPKNRHFILKVIFYTILIKYLRKSYKEKSFTWVYCFRSCKQFSLSHFLWVWATVPGFPASSGLWLQWLSVFCRLFRQRSTWYHKSSRKVAPLRSLLISSVGYLLHRAHWAQ